MNASSVPEKYAIGFKEGIPFLYRIRALYADPFAPPCWQKIEYSVRIQQAFFSGDRICVLWSRVAGFRLEPSAPPGGKPVVLDKTNILRGINPFTLPDGAIIHPLGTWIFSWYLDLCDINRRFGHTDCRTFEEFISRPWSFWEAAMRLHPPKPFHENPGFKPPEIKFTPVGFGVSRRRSIPMKSTKKKKKKVKDLRVVSS